MVRDKIRIRFRKGGDLRLVSHHDLMRCFERMLRRAKLPFHSTEGFNPHPRMTFALSLALGIVGCKEVLDLEFDANLPPKEIRDRLARQAPAGLEILSVRRVARKASAQVTRVCYRLEIPPERSGELKERAAELLAASHCWVERARPQPRRIDIKPYLHDLQLQKNTLVIDLWVTPTGSARPDEVVRQLGAGDLLNGGAVLERSRLELDDKENNQG